MQIKHAIKLHRVTFMLCFLLLLPLFLFITSCNKKEKSLDLGFNMNCVTLTQSQVQAWADSGWLNPADSNRVKYLYMNFYSGGLSGVSSNMQLVAYPASSFTNIKTTGKTILAIDTSVAAESFSGEAALASSYVCLTELQILNLDGSVKNFGSIRFCPNNVNPPYIGFTMENTMTSAIDTTRWPCPPYCCPGPCCPISFE